MPVDTLVAAADDALRTVLELALQADGYRVRAAGTEADALDALATEPDLVVLEMDAPCGEAVWLRLLHDGSDTPRVLLVPAWGDRETPDHPAAVILTMPFGREELRRALAEVARLAKEPGG